MAKPERDPGMPRASKLPHISPNSSVEEFPLTAFAGRFAADTSLRISAHRGHRNAVSPMPLGKGAGNSQPRTAP